MKRDNDLSIREKVVDLIRNKSTSLPTLPVVINNIIITAKNDKTTAADLAGFIANDQTLSARILKIANSVYYGQPKEIDSITRAIIVIGFKEIVSIALGSEIFKTFSTKNSYNMIDMNELWKHSIAVGFAFRHLEKKTRMSFTESAMLSGLLHDIGKIIFILYFPKDYEAVLEEQRRADDVPLDVMERKMLGIDHSEMAYLLMKQWNFPANINLPIRFHHNLSECPFEHLNMATMINIADYLCHRCGIGFSGNLVIERHDSAITGLGLSIESIDTIVHELEEDRPQVDGFLEAMA
ncbi:MAG TPA: HDOD domain-containing protein [Deltaproteobacteria bacterium]|nr:HDOD domain-containing protein [Deltaproteobacteria bacterium]